MIFLGVISRSLSRKGRGRFGEIIGDILRLASSGRKNITLENIAKSFPEKDRTWHISVMKDSYRNLGITLAELLALPSFEENDIREMIKYENAELINEIYSRGKGLMLLSGHYGNWELLAYSAGLYSQIPITIIVKPQKNKYADELLNKYRTQAGNEVISMYHSARKVFKILRNGGALALLADQSASKEDDIFIEFFGRKASTFQSPAFLALKLDVPIIMGFAVRQPDYTYRVRLQEIRHDDLDPDEEGIKELSRRHVKMLENAIREHPGLWAWQHRRWKHTPKDQEDYVETTRDK